MKLIKSICLLCFAFAIIACGGEDKKKKEKPFKVVKAVPASQRIALKDEGVGPSKGLTFDAEIDQAMSDKGAEIFKLKCTACHKVDKKFIGPSPQGIYERRNPSWVMNMILNPDRMVKENQLAKDLLMEFNGSPMANQNLSQDEARAIVEYFRTLK